MNSEIVIALCVLALTALAVVLSALGMFGQSETRRNDPPGDITIVVTSHGIPAVTAVLVTSDGLEFPVDPNTAQVVLPAECAGKLIMIRDRASRRELKRFVPRRGVNIQEI